MPRAGASPVPWWNNDIAEARKACFMARRQYTRKRKKAGEVGSTAERDNFKQLRKMLTSKILEAKDKNWSDLCAQVDGDPWGVPYKIVTKRLARRKPIPGLEIPGRLDTIVDRLFPRRPVTGRTIDTVSNEETAETKFTVNELKVVARCLPNSKAPGPDGIPNEVLRSE